MPLLPAVVWKMSWWPNEFNPPMKEGRDNRVKQQFSMYDMIVGRVVNPSAQGIYNPQSLKNLQRLSDSILTLEGVKSRELMTLNTVDNITQSSLITSSSPALTEKLPASCRG